MKYSIRQNHLNKTMLFEDGIQVGEPNAPELEFWARIQELENIIAENTKTIQKMTSAVEEYLQFH